MIAETLENKKERALAIIKCLKKMYPGAKIELDFKTPIQLVVAVILSAQCTDKRVNMVTPALFKKYRTAQDFARAKQSELEKLIHSTGFYKAKAKSIIGCAKRIVERFGGKVPNQMEDLTTLPGVGRKTANVILGNIYDTPGLVVDTHMIRVANRLGLTDKADPHKIEIQLCEVIPQKEWTLFSHLIIWHGRRCCSARKPNCPACDIKNLCPSRQDLKQVPVGLEKNAH